MGFDPEQVTFGGVGFDRAERFRRDEAALAELIARPDTRAILLWRGRPLVLDDQDALVRFPLDAPILRNAGAPIFLGLPEDAPLFAYALQGWEPGDTAAPADAPFDNSRIAHPEITDARFAELRGVMAALSPLDAELAATARALFEWHRSHGYCAACGAKSEMAKAGWERQCPACNRPHFPRTDPVVIMLVTRGERVLLGRSPHFPEGLYSLLAGFVEPGETLEAAVRREVAEEAGIAVGKVSYLASQPWPFPASLMIGCAGEAHTDEIQIDPAEIADARWVDKEELLMAMQGRHETLKPARKGSIAQFLLANWLADKV